MSTKIRSLLADPRQQRLSEHCIHPADEDLKAETRRVAEDSVRRIASSTAALMPSSDAVATLALDGCRIDRVVGQAVEIVTATHAHRSFPARVNESLGICLKSGPAHEVQADGRVLHYPADAICIRTPGTVWSTRETGPSAFLSIDIEAALLPAGRLVGPMRFVPSRALRDLGRSVDVLRSDADALEKQVVVAELIDALLGAGLVFAPDLLQGVDPRAAARARELLTSRLSEPPSLQELADDVGANRFVLLRSFRRLMGVPPHAFVRHLRVERARAMLARGADLAATSNALGFADQSHFTRAFKRIVGVSPGAYRREIRHSFALRSMAFKTALDATR